MKMNKDATISSGCECVPSSLHLIECTVIEIRNTQVTPDDPEKLREREREKSSFTIITLDEHDHTAHYIPYSSNVHETHST